MRVIFLIIFIVLCSLLSGIDVAGSIYEDTVWSPENNPYHVVGDITVEEGAKLTIEPGVLVMMKSMMMYDHDDFLNNALYSSANHTGISLCMENWRRLARKQTASDLPGILIHYTITGVS